MAEIAHSRRGRQPWSNEFGMVPVNYLQAFGAVAAASEWQPGVEVTSKRCLAILMTGALHENTAGFGEGSIITPGTAYRAFEELSARGLLNKNRLQKQISLDIVIKSPELWYAKQMSLRAKTNAIRSYRSDEIARESNITAQIRHQFFREVASRQGSSTAEQEARQVMERVVSSLVVAALEPPVE